MKRKRNLFSMLLAICMLVTLIPTTATASSPKLKVSAATSGSGNDIRVKRVTYDKEDSGDRDRYGTELEVDFLTRVTWKSNARVTVKDNKGITYKARLNDKDSNECDIYIKNLKEGRSYTIVISGIKKRGTSGYRKLTLKTTVPAEVTSSGKITVSKVTVDDDNDDYDKYATEIDIKFASDVTWKRNAKITSVKDNKGKSYKGYLTDRDDDDCEVYIKNLNYGRTYTIKISGVKARGASSYQTLTVKATVPARSNKLSVKSVEYDEDEDDGQMEYTVKFDFNKKVRYKSSSYVLIKDTAGKSYSSKSAYLDWDDDECEVYLSGELSYGKTYTYQIVNVKATGEKSYTSLKGSFTAQ